MFWFRFHSLSPLVGMKLLIYLSFCCAVQGSFNQPVVKKRNVVIIMADDLGFNDVSFRGSDEIPTPNIDALAYNGAIMNRFYTPPLCTPSRGSLMTGKYPYRIGLQNFVIPSDEPWSLGKEEKILPQHFKDAGYSTHLVGKWHLGFYQQQYTPTHRGFDEFFGYLGPYIDYWDHTLKDFVANYSRGHDMRRNLTVVDDIDPIYATDLFTNEAVKVIEKHDNAKPLFLCLNHLAPHAGNEDFPMQAPEKEIEKFSYIANKKRRTLAAMISVLDQGVGAVVKALKDKKMLESTIIVFYSDNGGPTIGQHSTNASNYPLRGQKHSGWEGAIRTNAIVYAPFLQNQGVVRNQLMHVTDLFPTLLRQAGVKPDKLSRLKLDGLDQWSVINNGGNPVRNEVVNIDNVFGFGMYTLFTYKLVNGTLADGSYDGWLASKNNNGNSDPVSYAVDVLNSVASRAIMSSQKRNPLSVDKILELRKAATVSCTNGVERNPCDLKAGPCLFDIYDDPCEENNLAQTRPAILKAMLKRYNNLKATAVPSRRKLAERACDPINFNMNWNWWQMDS